MGVLERWDERNQAWADRKRAEPVKPLRLPLGGRWWWVVTAMVVVVLLMNLAAEQWVSAAVFGAWSAVRIGLLIWVRRREVGE
jgi:hypothetical protein